MGWGSYRKSTRVGWNSHRVNDGYARGYYADGFYVSAKGLEVALLQAAGWGGKWNWSCHGWWCHARQCATENPVCQGGDTLCDLIQSTATISPSHVTSIEYVLCVWCCGCLSLFPPCPPSLLRPCGFGFPTTVTHVILMILFARLETPAVTRSSHVRLFSLPLTVNHFISVLCVLVWVCFALPPPPTAQGSWLRFPRVP